MCEKCGSNKKQNCISWGRTSSIATYGLTRDNFLVNSIGEVYVDRCIDCNEVLTMYVSNLINTSSNIKIKRLKE